MGGYWKSVTIPEGDTRHWSVGLLELWVHHGPSEWQIWHSMAEDPLIDGSYALGEPCEKPDRPVQQRFASDASSDSLILRPAYPDRPIVSYPGSKVSVPAKSEASFVCGIPLAMQLVSGANESASALMTLPLRHLSKTWFGTPLAGEPCYSASTAAVRDHRELTANKYRALCPVFVVNRTKKPLPIERICIHVEHLELFEGEDFLWTNDVTVSKEAESETSRVTYGSGPPSTDSGAQLVLCPREIPPSRSVFLKTFNHLRTVLAE